jgi:sulfur-oxidizing protein SoxY
MFSQEKSMNFATSRRHFLRGVLAATALAALPLQLFARNKAAFTATAEADVLKSLFGDKPVKESAEVNLKVPDIAENGAVVPVTVSTAAAGAQSIAIIVAENPNPLSARFQLVGGIDADISTRIKMGASSDVIAAVETADAVLVTRKNVKVTIGGCGG